MIKPSDMLEIFESYDRTTIATLGSHSALQIFKGAKEEGFGTLAVCEKGRETAYRRFGVVDEILTLDKFSDILKKEVIEKLRSKNCVLIPHGSLIAYVGVEGIEEKLSLPIFGNRNILRWESDRKIERQWLEKAGIEMPKETKNPKDISGLSLVKFPGAKGGRGYFIVNNYSDFLRKSEEMLDKKRISRRDLKNATIQEYIPGVNMYISYFYSPIKEVVELFGLDKRYESNIDGLTRIPAVDQANSYIEPSYVVAGNIPLVARESLVNEIFRMGDDIVRISKEIAPPGMLGPFCLETMVTQNLKFIAFEISARIVAGTNPYTAGSPYSYLLYGPGMSMGKRIALEIKNALKEGKEDKIIT